MYEGVQDPGALSRPRNTFRPKKIKGVRHKICFGPAHDVPTWLPATDKYFYRHKSGRKQGMLVSRCLLCVNWDKLDSPGISGTVSARSIQPFVTELVHRIGKAEAARRAEVSPTTLLRILRATDNSIMIQKRTVRALMLQVISARRKNEVYHRADIRGGLRSKKRKRPLRPVTSQRDLYKPTGDSDLALRKISRDRK